MTLPYRIVAFTLLGIATLGMVWLFRSGGLVNRDAANRIGEASVSVKTITPFDL